MPRVPADFAAAIKGLRLDSFRNAIGAELARAKVDADKTAARIRANGAAITEAGLRMNVNVGIYYLGSWLAGNGCVPIYNLMEDAATAEISRSQVWQWIRSPKGVLEDGRKITAEMVKTIVAEELQGIKEAGYEGNTIDRAATIFEQMSTQEEFAEFLTLALYEEI
jgi:malate synthase